MMDELVRTSKVIICAGSGGVGKTTVSAAIAVRAAELGLKTLVLTVDPARRLATTLGIADHQSDDVRVPGQNFSGELYASVLDSRRIFDHFVQSTAASPELAQKLMGNPLYVQLSTTLSGSQEFTALEKLHEAVESGLYDLIVLDTPPTQHALDFLLAPQKIENLFQEAVTKWLLIPGRGSGWLRGLLSQGTRQALKAMESLTGARFIEALIDFFASIHSFQTTLRDHSRVVKQLLAHPQTRFVLVTSFDAAKLQEAHFFLSELFTRGYHLSAVIINRAFPDWLDNKTQLTQTKSSPEREVLFQFYEQLRQSYGDRIALYEKFQSAIGKKVTVLKIPEFNQDISELKGLQHVYGSLRT